MVLYRTGLVTPPLTAKQIIHRLLKFCFILASLITALAQAQIPLRATHLSTGNPFCAITAAGGVKCWGPQYATDTSETIYRTAVDMHGLESGVIAVTHRCALSANGTVKCWGSNSFNQLGTGDGISSVTPVLVPNLNNVIAITSGEAHNCALIADGRVKCWGSNERGQLGQGTTGNLAISEPVVVQGLSGAVSISAGIYHSCALLNTGGVKCWGDDSYGQLGIGLEENDHTAKDVYGLNAGVVQVSVGGVSACALMDNGSLKCWGYDPLVPDSRFPTEMEGFPEPLRQISAGYSDKCAITASGALGCWGSHYGGPIDSMDTGAALRFVSISELGNNLDEVRIGDSSTCARQGTTVKCWGANNAGQLGNNGDEDSETPVTTLQSFAPFVGLATASNGQAVVHFSPPTDDSGSPITGYTVTTTPAAGTDLYAGSTASYNGASDLSHLITGLVNGTSYRFTVTATNALGTGLPSALSNQVTPTGPATSSASSSSSSSSVVSSSATSTSSSTSSSASVISTSSSRSSTSSSVTSSSAVSSSVATSTATSSTISSSSLSSSRSSSSNSSSVSSSSSSAVAQRASCTYVVSNQWNNGFTAAIRISNTGTSAINGWAVSWQYTDGSFVTSGWNSTMTGSNPYTATNLNWNSAIQPGQTVEFGIQGSKPNGLAASSPAVTGTLCR